MSITGLFDEFHIGEIDPGRYDLQDLHDSKKVYGHVFMQRANVTGGRVEVDVVLFAGYPGMDKVRAVAIPSSATGTVTSVLADAKKRGIPHRYDHYEAANRLIFP